MSASAASSTGSSPAIWRNGHVVLPAPEGNWRVMPSPYFPAKARWGTENYIPQKMLSGGWRDSVSASAASSTGSPPAVWRNGHVVLPAPEGNWRVMPSPYLPVKARWGRGGGYGGRGTPSRARRGGSPPPVRKTSPSAASCQPPTVCRGGGWSGCAGGRRRLFCGRGCAVRRRG